MSKLVLYLFFSWANVVEFPFHPINFFSLVAFTSGLGEQSLNYRMHKSLEERSIMNLLWIQTTINYVKSGTQKYENIGHRSPLRIVRCTYVLPRFLADERKAAEKEVREAGTCNAH